MSNVEINRSFLGTEKGSNAEMHHAEESVRNSYGIKAENLTERGKVGMDHVLSKVSNIRRNFMATWSLQRCDTTTHAGRAKLAGLVIGNIFTAGLMSGIATLICRVKEARAFSSSQNALNMLGQAALTYDTYQKTTNEVAENRMDSDGNNLIAVMRNICTNEDGFLDGHKVAQFMAIVDFTEDQPTTQRSVGDFGAQREALEGNFGSSSIGNPSALKELKASVVKKTFKEVVAARLAEDGNVPTREHVEAAIKKYAAEVYGKEEEVADLNEDVDAFIADLEVALRGQEPSSTQPAEGSSSSNPAMKALVEKIREPLTQRHEAAEALNRAVEARISSNNTAYEASARDFLDKHTKLQEAKADLLKATKAREDAIKKFTTSPEMDEKTKRTFTLVQKSRVFEAPSVMETTEAVKRAMARFEKAQEAIMRFQEATIDGSSVQNAVYAVHSANEAVNKSRNNLHDLVGAAVADRFFSTFNEDLLNVESQNTYIQQNTQGAREVYEQAKRDHKALNDALQNGSINLGNFAKDILEIDNPYTSFTPIAAAILDEVSRSVAALRDPNTEQTKTQPEENPSLSEDLERISSTSTDSLASGEPAGPAGARLSRFTAENIQSEGKPLAAAGSPPSASNKEGADEKAE